MVSPWENSCSSIIVIIVFVAVFVWSRQFMKTPREWSYRANKGLKKILPS